MDLGGGYSARFFSWKPDRDIQRPDWPHRDKPDVERAGLIITCPHEEVGGSIFFDRPETAHLAPSDHRWAVESWDPLTLSPSILMNECGCHGFIRAGRWVPA
jgi:hypothetical protein